MRRWGVALVALLVLSIPMACSKTDAPTPVASDGATPPADGDGGSADDGAPAKKVFKEDDTSIKVAVGEKFGIRVDENASIGDAWKLVSAPDPSILKDEGNSYKAEPGEPKPGSGGQREFKFKARAPGSTTVTLFDCYRCSTGGQVSPENSSFARRITFTVIVG